MGEYLSANLSDGMVEIVTKTFPDFDENTLVIKIFAA
jgi:hypothetical protein